MPKPKIKKQEFVTNSSVKSRQQFEVIQRNPRMDMKGVKVDGHKVEFGEKSRAALIDDPGLARAIHDSSGQGGTGDCLVVPVEKPSDPNHRRTFTVPELPWHKE
jgi:hypothetical protein